ncbi:MAG: PH domain-containing protein [Bacilli bacterium]
MLNKQRLHFSTIFENILSIIVFIFIILFSTLDNIVVNIMKDIDLTKYHNINMLGFCLALLVIIIAFLIVFIIYYIKWLNTYVYFDKDTFVIEKGKLFKKTTTIKLKDISNINMKKNIFQKTIGTCQLKLDLNNMENNITTKLVFKESTAIAIKNNIVNKEEIKTLTGHSLLNFKLKDIIKHSLMSLNIISMLFLLIIYMPFIFYLTNNYTSIIIIILMSISAIWMIISKTLGYMNFCLVKNDDHLTVSYGFFTTITNNIYFDKINAVIINQSLQARIFKKYLIEVVIASSDDDEKKKQILSLYVSNKVFNTLMTDLLADYITTNKIINQEPKALITIVLNNLLLIIIIIVMSYNISPYILLLLLIILLNIILTYKTKKLMVADKLVIIDGIYNKRTSIIKYEKIEQIKITKSLFARLVKLNNLTVYIIGSNLNSIFKTGYFTKTVSEEVINKMFSKLIKYN